jgi:hypothetical protein
MRLARPYSVYGGLTRNRDGFPQFAVRNIKERRRVVVSLIEEYISMKIKH